MESNGQKHIAFADGMPVPVADENSEGHWFNSLCHAHGLSPRAVEEFLAEYETHFHHPGETQNALAIVDWHRSDLAALDAYQGNQGMCDPRFLHLSRRCFILAHGPAYAHLAGSNNPTELARQLGLAKILGGSGKATAQKCFSQFQKILKLPPLPGQRDQAARANMRRARKLQLEKHK